MNLDFAAAMRRATQLTRAQNITGAMRVIQAALAGRRAASADRSAPENAILPAVSTAPEPRTTPEDAAREAAIPPAADTVAPATASEPLIVAPVAERLRKPLGEVLETLRQGKARISGLDTPFAFRSRRRAPSIPAGARFLSRSFACAAGMRNYKLYVPASAPKHFLGLVVMLHGCKQDPDDFAAGTNMNTLAERRGVLVAYPAQSNSANASSCWNWFRPGDQMRDAGEPAIIAGLTREIMSEFGLERGQAFVAGLSAGGAMAAVMGQTYPDLYAAIGVHSGLAFGSANDVMSAFAAMRGETGVLGQRARAGTGKASAIRTIVFHGSADATVHPTNAERIMAAANREAAPGQVRRERHVSAGGRHYLRTTITAPDGGLSAEYWLIEGAGHAWSGGNADGSYTDPTGPDASAEMLRFFFGPAKQIPNMDAGK